MLDETVKRITPVNEAWYGRAQARLDRLTKPQGSLGRLEEFARRIVAITEEEKAPSVDKKVIFTFAGDHGVTEEGVSLFPKEVTRQMVFNFLAGGAGINVLARHAGAEVAVIDIGVDFDFGEPDGLISRKILRGTKNIVKGPAMTKTEAIACIEVGIELAEQFKDRGFLMFGTGEMGIGNTTPASAIASVITGRPVAEVTGRGTGISDTAWRGKVAAIEQAIAVNHPDPSDALEVLACLGGAEIGGIAGVCLGAAAFRIPVVVDGFISTAGALIASTLAPAVRDYMFAAHHSVEVGHKAMLAHMGLRPILDLELRLGEGTGAALAMSLIEAGVKIYTEMATFAEAGVSDHEA